MGLKRDAWGWKTVRGIQRTKGRCYSCLWWWADPGSYSVHQWLLFLLPKCILLMYSGPIPPICPCVVTDSCSTWGIHPLAGVEECLSFLMQLFWKIEQIPVEEAKVGGNIDSGNVTLVSDYVCRTEAHNWHVFCYAINAFVTLMRQIYFHNELC